MYRRTVALMASLLSPWPAVDARADLLLEVDGVELHGTLELVRAAATYCEVTTTDYLLANHGKPMDLWRVHGEVRNRTGRWLDHVIASYWVESERPGCEEWDTPEGMFSIDIQSWGLLNIIRSRGRNVVAPGAVLTDETDYLILLRGDPAPHFRDWRLDYRLGAGGDSDSDPEAAEAALGLDRTTRRQLQRGLQAAGFSPGAADGLFGPRTRAAIRSWQRSRSEPPTGYLDAASAAALRPVGSASAGQPPGATSRADLEFWQSIANSTNPLMFEGYLSRFPNGAFRALAQNRLAVLGRSAAAAPASARAEPAPRAETPRRTEARRSREPVRTPALRSRPAGQQSGATSRADLAFWQSIANSTSPSVFESYLSQFPNGAFRALAQNRLAVLGRSAAAPRASARAEPAPRAETPRRPEARRSPEGRRPAPEATSAVSRPDAARRPGDVFRDCAECPEMVVLPGGRLAMGRYEVTVGEYRAFSEATGGGAGSGCATRPGTGSWRDPGFPQTDRHPVTCMNGDDAREYVSWLSRRTGAAYRLPTEAEWVRAAGSSEPGCYDRPSSQGTCPVGSYGADGAGLSDMLGNVEELTSTCYRDWVGRRCSTSNTILGACWDNSRNHLRLSYRNHYSDASLRVNTVGFRVVRTLD